MPSLLSFCTLKRRERRAPLPGKFVGSSTISVDKMLCPAQGKKEYEKTLSQQEVMVANVVWRLFVSTFSCVLFVECATWRLAALWIDVCHRRWWFGSGASRKPHLATDLDECAGNFCSLWSLRSLGWQAYCKSAFQECVEHAIHDTSYHNNLPNLTAPFKASSENTQSSW